METKTIVTYVVCDEVVKLLGIREDPQIKMTLAEIMTVAIISAIQYSGNLEKARRALSCINYIPNMLSKSQLNRRLHGTSDDIWNAVLKRLSIEFEKCNLEQEFVIDSCPIPACRLVRQNKTKLYKDKKYLGYCAAKQEFFIGFKLHMVSDAKGNPIDLLLRPACESDIKVLKKIDLDLPKNSRLYADKAYNDYVFEDSLFQKKYIHLIPIRKKNSKRKGSDFLECIRKKKRRIIESAFSCIEKLMPRSIHAVTIAGFKLKSMLFVLAYAFNKVVF